MLRITVLELFIRGLPEALILIFAIYTFSKKKVILKPYLLSSLLIAVILYLVRLLPIQYGINTILGMSSLLILVININKINMISAIKAILLATILDFVSEIINIFIIRDILKLNIVNIFKNPWLKILYGIPSLAIFLCTVLIYYMRLFKRQEFTCCMSNNRSIN